MADRNKSNGKRNNIWISICIILLFCILGAVLLVKYVFSTEEGLSDDNLIIYEGHMKQLKLYHKSSKKVIWSSSDENIVTVTDSGEVEALSEGETQVLATLGKKSYTCQVTVKKPVSPIYYGKAESEKQWILEQRLANGLLTNRCDEDNTLLLVNPYFSSVVANAILECSEDESDYEYVRDYIDWYFESINTEEDYNGLIGTIYDYAEVLDETGEIVLEYPYGQYDSVDSYAALFLITLYNYCYKTGDVSCVTEHEYELGLITDVMLNTIEADYSITKPDYLLKYLMDNSEVYEGLRCVEGLYGSVLQDYDRQKTATELREKMKNAFEETWWQNGYYSTSLNENNEASGDFSWEVFYPDAVSQLYPIIYGLASAEHAHEIYDKFCEEYDWQNMDYFSEGRVDYYWGVVCYAAVIMGDAERVQKYIETYEEMTQEREYPLIASDSAWVMLSEYRLAQYYEYLENQ